MKKKAMENIIKINNELERIGASSIVCNKHFFGEPQYQLLDEQWESDFMFAEKLLDFLNAVIDGAGPNVVWEYLKFERIPLMSVPQTDDSREGLKLKRLKTKGNST